MPTGLGRSAPNVYKKVEGDISTTISAAWDPAAGKAVRVMGFELTNESNTDTSLYLTEGTAAASGTIWAGVFSTDQPSKSFKFPGGKRLGADAVLGLRSDQGGGIAFTGMIYGREDTPV